MGPWEHAELSMKYLVKGPKVREGTHVARKNKPGLISFLTVFAVCFSSPYHPFFKKILLFSVFWKVSYSSLFCLAFSPF